MKKIFLILSIIITSFFIIPKTFAESLNPTTLGITIDNLNLSWFDYFLIFLYNVNYDL